MSDSELRGRRVLVTGGSMGIGYACAEAVLRAGAQVMIAARGHDALSAAADRLSGFGPVHFETADVAQPTQVTRLFDAADVRLGGLDGVIHAAAVLGPVGPATDTDPAAWWEAVRSNLFGSFLVATEAARRMSAAEGGRIVLFSGGGATAPFPNFTAYGSSKAAVVRFAETLAREVEPAGVAVNCVAPGLVATRMQEQTLAAGERAGAAYVESVRLRLQTAAVPAELGAEAAVFLISAASAGITGRLLAAPWDEWRTWPDRLDTLRDSDLFTLRRIVPADRGIDWS